MPVEYFIRYKGKCYGVGTKLRFAAKNFNDVYVGDKVGVIKSFYGNLVYIEADDGCTYTSSVFSHLSSFDKEIKEIIEPVYYEEPPVEYRPRRHYPSSDSLFTGWVWYIVIMAAAFIFKDALMIWLFASVVFFLWKNGFLGGKKK